jgi:hypothetical protein
MTFLNPNDKLRGHSTAANNADSLMNNVRVFWSIDCWQEVSEEVLTTKLKKYSDDKSKLNQNSPIIPRWAYRKAKVGIEAGVNSGDGNPSYRL